VTQVIFSFLLYISLVFGIKYFTLTNKLTNLSFLSYGLETEQIFKNIPAIDYENLWNFWFQVYMVDIG